MLLRRGAIALTLLLAGALAAPASAATTTRETTHLPMAGVPITVTCTDGPTWDLTGREGTIRATTTSVVNGTSGRLSFHMTYQGVSATDADGTVYRLSGGITESMAYRAEPPTSFRERLAIRYVVTAPREGLLVHAHAVVHLVMGPSGRITGTVEHTRFTCPGDPA